MHRFIAFFPCLRQDEENSTAGTNLFSDHRSPMGNQASCCECDPRDTLAVRGLIEEAADPSCPKRSTLKWLGDLPAVDLQCLWTMDESDKEMIWQMRAKSREHPLTSGRHHPLAEAPSRLPRGSRTRSTAPQNRADTVTRPPATATVGTVSTITATATPTGACLLASAARELRHHLPKATAITITTTTTTAPIAHSRKRKTTC